MYILIIIIIVGFVYFALRKNKSTDLEIDSSSDSFSDDDDLDDYIVKKNEREKEFSYFLKDSNFDEVPSLIQKHREVYAEKSLSKLVDTYYELLQKLQDAKKQKKYDLFIQYCQMSLPLIEPLIVDTKHSYGSFDLKGIPAIEEVLPHYAVLGLRGQIKNIEETVCFFPELAPWKEQVFNAEKMREMASKIYKCVKENPGVLQKDLKKYIDGVDGRFLSNVAYYMAIHKKIIREKKGSSYMLSIKEA